VKLKLLLLAIEVKPDEGGDSKVRRILETISNVFNYFLTFFYLKLFLYTRLESSVQKLRSWGGVCFI
jgi:uncharacterized membrane protein